MYNVIDFSKYVVDSLGEVSTMKLQKIIYYVQGWYLGVKGEKLIDTDFEAWVYGPVSPDLYRKYAGQAIVGKGSAGGRDIVFENAEIKEFIDLIIDEYSQYSAYQLSEMTHSETPWLEARGELRDDQPSQNIISVESIRDYFRGLL